MSWVAPATGKTDLSMNHVRPTLRVLRDDLRIPIPSAQVPLETISHPLIGKASDQFAGPETAHERIRAIDDVVLFKVKVQRWRGAVWHDGPDAEVSTWLVAAGTREEGSGDDFYVLGKQREGRSCPLQRRARPVPDHRHLQWPSPAQRG